MRFMFAALVMMIVSAAAMLAVLKDNGYVMIAYGHWSVEGSLATLILAIAVLFVVLYLLIRFLAKTFAVPSSMKSWSENRGIKQARSSLTRGLLELSEGRWKGAEKHLIQNVQRSEMPLINYLGAARAAQLQGEDEKRDRYLQLAHESLPSADVAVGLTQAELQLSHQQFEQALATLTHLRSISPKHSYVLKLLGKLYERLGEWDALQELLPELKRRKVLSAEELNELDIRIQRNLMLSHQNDPTALTLFWNKLSRAMRSNIDVIVDYCRLLQGMGQCNQLESLVSDVLNREWNSELVVLYGMLESDNKVAQLSQAETWLEKHPADSDLLLSLGRICLRNRLWGKARGYYEASIGSKPSPEAFRELGELLLQLGETEQAGEYFKTGLSLMVGTPNFSLPSPEQNVTEVSDDDEVAPSTALVGSN